MSQSLIPVLALSEILAGRYRIERLVGSGRMGYVYACRHIELPSHVAAMKILYPEIASNEVLRARFRNEVIAFYRVSHPNVVRAYEYINEQDLLAYTMEYVDGVHLGRLMGVGEKPLSVPEVTNILLQICEGVHAIHVENIVHRDLKPENILLTTNGTVKITDFGIARLTPDQKLTNHGEVVGTIDYVSPEYLIDSKVDRRSDIYALGILTYEMLVGEVPFRGESIYDTLMKKVKSPPPSPSNKRRDCPEELDAIVRKMLRQDPGERYQSIAEIMDALKSLNRLLAREDVPPPFMPFYGKNSVYFAVDPYRDTLTLSIPDFKETMLLDADTSEGQDSTTAQSPEANSKPTQQETIEAQKSPLSVSPTHSETRFAPWSAISRIVSTFVSVLDRDRWRSKTRKGT